MSASPLADKTLVFTVTAGRTGTAYLEKLLGEMPGVWAGHEAQPNFVHMMRRVQSEPWAAERFWDKHKAPFIAQQAGPVYAETSHLFCKGFLELLLQRGLTPKLIGLRRHPRAVAKSFMERQCIPGRTLAGLSYCLMPGDPLTLPLPGWERAHDYELCFWMALDMEERLHRYRLHYLERGLEIFDTTARELNGLSQFQALLDYIGVDWRQAEAAVAAAHARLSEGSHNPSPNKMRADPAALEKLEARVWDCLRFYAPGLRQRVEGRYAAEAEGEEGGG